MRPAAGSAPGDCLTGKTFLGISSPPFFLAHSESCYLCDSRADVRADVPVPAQAPGQHTEGKRACSLLAYDSTALKFSTYFFCCVKGWFKKAESYKPSSSQTIIPPGSRNPANTSDLLTPQMRYTTLVPGNLLPVRSPEHPTCSGLCRQFCLLQTAFFKQTARPFPKLQCKNPQADPRNGEEKLSGLVPPGDLAHRDASISVSGS